MFGTCISFVMRNMDHSPFLQVETCPIRRVVPANTPMVLDPVLEMVIFASEPDTIRSVSALDEVTYMTPVSTTMVDPVGTLSLEVLPSQPADVVATPPADGRPPPCSVPASQLS
jgi:hypothetical protein